jgi:uncharacterized protein
MSDAKSPQDLSMDEILATIRRIIAEDERSSNPATRGVPPGVSSGRAAGERREPARAPVEAVAANDILDLTDALNEDGSVQRLAPPDGSAGASEATVPATAPPTSGGIDPVIPTEARAEPTETAPIAARPAEAEPSDASLETDRPAPAEASAPPNRAADPVPPPPAAQSSATQPLSTPGDSAKNAERLISDVAALAAATAFGRLAAVPRSRREPPLVAGRPLDDVVRELLHPLLRTWLDENLPGIVERLVQQEIARISARSGPG